MSKTATPENLKRTYRQLARKYHPDLNPRDNEAEAKFKDLNEANARLSDPEKRQKYDQFGQHWNQPNYSEAPTPQRNDAATGGFEQYDDFEAFINDLLGRSRRRASTSRTAPSSFDNLGGGFRSQATAPNTEAEIADYFCATRFFPFDYNLYRNQSTQASNQTAVIQSNEGRKLSRLLR